MAELSAQELNLLIEQTYKVEKEFTELKHSYENLQDTIEQVVEFLPNSIWILNADNSIFLQNSKAREEKDLLHYLEFKNEDYELSIHNKSYLVKSSIYKDKYMISATDITEQKRKENLATMGQMAAHLSHEIRNPIGSISLLSSTLKKRVKPENEAIVQEIQNSVYRIERIIKATLMFSKGVQTDKKPFSWYALQELLLQGLEYYAYTKEIKFNFPSQDFMIYGDKELLAMMFSNFIINAIDAIELDDHETGSIRLQYDTQNKMHIFKIYDSGIAIENKENLFEAFTSTKLKGNGLGLVLAQQIAQAHNGSVQLLEEEEKGFIITIEV